MTGIPELSPEQIRSDVERGGGLGAGTEQTMLPPQQGDGGLAAERAEMEQARLYYGTGENPFSFLLQPAEDDIETEQKLEQSRVTLSNLIRQRNLEWIKAVESAGAQNALEAQLALESNMLEENQQVDMLRQGIEFSGMRMPDDEESFGHKINQLQESGIAQRNAQWPQVMELAATKRKEATSLREAKAEVMAGLEEATRDYTGAAATSRSVLDQIASGLTLGSAPGRQEIVDADFKHQLEKALFKRFPEEDEDYSRSLEALRAMKSSSMPAMNLGQMDTMFQDADTLRGIERKKTEAGRQSIPFPSRVTSMEREKFKEELMQQLAPDLREWGKKHGDALGPNTVEHLIGGGGHAIGMLAPFGLATKAGVKGAQALTGALRTLSGGAKAAAVSESSVKGLLEIGAARTAIGKTAQNLGGEIAGVMAAGFLAPPSPSQLARIESEVEPEDRATANFVQRLENGVLTGALLPFFKLAPAAGRGVARATGTKGLAKAGMMGIGEGMVFPVFGAVGQEGIDAIKSAGFEKLDELMERAVLTAPSQGTFLRQLAKGDLAGAAKQYFHEASPGMWAFGALSMLRARPKVQRAQHISDIRMLRKQAEKEVGRFVDDPNVAKMVAEDREMFEQAGSITRESLNRYFERIEKEAVGEQRPAEAFVEQAGPKPEAKAKAAESLREAAVVKQVRPSGRTLKGAREEARSDREFAQRFAESGDKRAKAEVDLHKAEERALELRSMEHAARGRARETEGAQGRTGPLAEPAKRWHTQAAEVGERAGREADLHQAYVSRLRKWVKSGGEEAGRPSFPGGKETRRSLTFKEIEGIDKLVDDAARELSAGEKPRQVEIERPGVEANFRETEAGVVASGTMGGKQVSSDVMPSKRMALEQLAHEWVADLRVLEGKARTQRLEEVLQARTFGEEQMGIQRPTRPLSMIESDLTAARNTLARNPNMSGAERVQERVTRLEGEAKISRGTGDTSPPAGKATPESPAEGITAPQGPISRGDVADALRVETAAAQRMFAHEDIDAALRLKKADRVGAIDQLLAKEDLGDRERAVLEHAKDLTIENGSKWKGKTLRAAAYYRAHRLAPNNGFVEKDITHIANDFAKSLAEVKTQAKGLNKADAQALYRDWFLAHRMDLEGPAGIAMQMYGHGTRVYNDIIALSRSKEAGMADMSLLTDAAEWVRGFSPRRSLYQRVQHIYSRLPETERRGLSKWTAPLGLEFSEAQGIVATEARAAEARTHATLREFGDRVWKNSKSLLPPKMPKEGLTEIWEALNNPKEWKDKVKPENYEIARELKEAVLDPMRDAMFDASPTRRRLERFHTEATDDAKTAREWAKSLEGEERTEMLEFAARREKNASDYAKELEAERESYGFENYVHHMTVGDEAAAFKEFAAPRNASLSAHISPVGEQSLVERMKRNREARAARRRTGAAEASGKVLKDARQATYWYLNSVVPYIQRAGFDRMKDRVLNGRSAMAGKVVWKKGDHRDPNQEVHFMGDAYVRLGGHLLSNGGLERTSGEGLNSKRARAVLWRGTDTPPTSKQLADKAFVEKQKGLGNIQVLTPKVAERFVRRFQGGWLELASKERIRDMQDYVDRFYGDFRRIQGQEVLPKLKRIVERSLRMGTSWASSMALGGFFNVHNAANAVAQAYLMNGLMQPRGKAPGLTAAADAKKYTDYAARVRKIDKTQGAFEYVRGENGEPIIRNKDIAAQLRSSPKAYKRAEAAGEKALRKLELEDDHFVAWHGSGINHQSRATIFSLGLHDNVGPGKQRIDPNRLEKAGSALQNAWMYPFQLAEQTVRFSAHRQGYLRARELGKSDVEARRDAMNYVHAVHMNFGRAANSRFFNKPIGAFFGNMSTWAAHNWAVVPRVGATGVAQYLTLMYTAAGLAEALGQDMYNQLGSRINEVPFIGDDLEYYAGQIDENLGNPPLLTLGLNFLPMAIPGVGPGPKAVENLSQAAWHAMFGYPHLAEQKAAQALGSISPLHSSQARILAKSGLHYKETIIDAGGGQKQYINPATGKPSIYLPPVPGWVEDMGPGWEKVWRFLVASGPGSTVAEQNAYRDVRLQFARNRVETMRRREFSIEKREFAELYKRAKAGDPLAQAEFEEKRPAFEERFEQETGRKPKRADMKQALKMAEKQPLPPRFKGVVAVSGKRRRLEELERVLDSDMPPTAEHLRLMLNSMSQNPRKWLREKNYPKALHDRLMPKIQAVLSQESSR